MLVFSFPYRNLVLQVSLCFIVTLILTVLKIPMRFLHGLFTYIHPDALSQDNGVRAAIRRPGSSDSSHSRDGYQNLSSRGNLEPKARNKSKKKPAEFDENNAQIFRLKLDEAHLRTRFYFSDYWYVFTYVVLGLSCLLLQHFLDSSDGILVDGHLVPILLGVLGILRAFASLAKATVDKSASKRSDKELSVAVGVLGSVLGVLVCLTSAGSVLDFGFESMDGVARLFLLVFMGCIASFLYMPATKCARAFWLGTDQLNWNLSIISCGWLGRGVLSANFLLTLVTSLLWINPFSECVVSKSSYDHKQWSSTNRTVEFEKLVGKVGMSKLNFANFRLWCLLGSGLLQFLAMRPNLQMYLNEAVLAWYQRLHASKVPDLEYSRAKVFLHNHYLCLALLQFLAPSALMLLFAGLSQVESNAAQSFQCNSLPCSAVVKEFGLFLAWWVAFVWATITSVTLALHRRGIRYVF